MHDELTDRDAGTTPYLIGLRFDPENEEPDFFLLLACGEKDRPVLVDDAIALFESPSHAAQVIERAGPDAGWLGPPPQEIELVCDVAGALYLVHGEDVDSSATIVNCLNTLFDLVAATRVAFPAEYQRVLYALADH